MNRKGFHNVYWGLVFVVLDVRIGPYDVFLPDIVGWVLIAMGVHRLSSDHPPFGRLTRLAVFLAVVSLIDFPTVKMSPTKAKLFRQQTFAALTGDLEILVPSRVGAANLVSTTSSEETISEERTHNPVREEDRLLALLGDTDAA